MIKQLMYKWFGLSDLPCQTCEVLRLQLDESNRERRELLARLLEKDTPEPVVADQVEPKAITPQFVPWRVRQQMLEAEDRHKATLLKNKQKEINELEKELGIVEEVQEK
jgi:hypothetical protein